MLRSLCPVLIVLALATGAPAAHAQFAVIDVASLTQLITQLQTLEQELDTARSQLAQAQAEYQSMTGGRGMQQLLAGVPRNYLPSDWSTLQGTLQGPGGSFPALTAAVRGALGAETVLSTRQLAVLSPPVAAQLQSDRQPAALLAGVTRQGLANASARFAAIQQLIDAIGSASDQKGILDLAARISAESGMLQNERTKMQALYQSAQAEQWGDAQRRRELAVVGHGQFANRFQPHP